MDDIADVRHAGDEHEHALETEAEARVGYAAVFPKIGIKAVGLGIELVMGEVG